MPEQNETEDVMEIGVARRNLVRLTGDHKRAMLLNQMIYWATRTDDWNHDKVRSRAKRHERAPEKVHPLKKSGWIQKSAKSLSYETQLGLSPKTTRKHISKLVEAGWLEERDSTLRGYGPDNRKEYRVNVPKIQRDLLALELNEEDIHDEAEDTEVFPLKDWALPEFVDLESKKDEEELNGDNRPADRKDRTVPEETKERKEVSKKRSGGSSGTLTEITSETTSDNNFAYLDPQGEPKPIADYLKIFNDYTDKRHYILRKSDKEKIYTRLRRCKEESKYEYRDRLRDFFEDFDTKNGSRLPKLQYFYRVAPRYFDDVYLPGDEGER